MSQAADRKKKILDLKKKIVGIYGSTLLPSSINQVSLEVIRKDDSEEVRAEKLEENRNIIAERDAAYKQREPELVYELDKIIDRIRMARSEYGSIDMLYSSGTAAIPVPKFICTQCGNKVANEPRLLILLNFVWSSCAFRDFRYCYAILQFH